ncbi:hypothetical protein EV122DRAFT_284204 [Schizophyllum commune]
MPMLPCPYCQEKFSTTRARSAHAARCPEKDKSTRWTVQSFQAAGRGRKRAAPTQPYIAPNPKATRTGSSKSSFAQRHVSVLNEQDAISMSAGPSRSPHLQDAVLSTSDPPELAAQHHQIDDAHGVQPTSPYVPLLEQEIRPLERSSRSRRIPKHFVDYVPSTAPRVLEHQIPQQILSQMHLPSPRQRPSKPLPPSTTPEDAENVAEPPVVIDLTYHSTRANEFGLYRIYKTLPSVDPDDSIDIEDLADGPHFVDSGARSQRTANLAFGHEFNTPPSAPFYAVTLSGLQRLVDDVIRPQTPEVFRPEDFLGFSASTEYNRLDRAISQDHDAASSGPLPWTAASGWREGHRNILEVIKEAFQDEQSREYHLRAHKVFWERSADEHPMRCWGEAYTSDRALETDDEL